jgi:hypothetical protein
MGGKVPTDFIPESPTDVRGRRAFFATRAPVSVTDEQTRHT